MSQSSGAAPTQEALSADANTVRAAVTVKAIGSRVRQLRLQRDLTLQAVADLTGLSPSLLSLVERGKTSPSIGTLVAVSHALDVHMGDLVPGNPPPGGAPVLRASDQRQFSTPQGIVRTILRDDRVRGLEISIGEYSPDSRSADDKLHHGGYEYGMIIEGTLTVDLEGGESYDLEVGDSIAYDSTLPHRIINRTDTPARALWVNLDWS